MSPIPIGILASSGGALSPYWFASYTGAAACSSLRAAVSSDGEMIAAYGTYAINTTDALFLLTNKFGELEVSKTLSAAGADNGTDIHFSASNYIFVAGNTPAPANHAALMRLNADGTINWGKKFEHSDSQSSATATIGKIAVDGDNVIAPLAMNFSAANSSSVRIARFNSAGTETHQTVLGGGGVSINGVAYNGTNYYLDLSLGSNDRNGVRRFTTALVKTFRSNTPGTYKSAVGAASTAFFSTNFNFVGSPRPTAVSKINDLVNPTYESPAPVLWTLVWNYGTSVNPVNEIATDSSGGIVLVDNMGTIIRSDTNGNVQWQRRVRLNGSTVIWQSVRFDAFGDLILGGYSSGTSPASACLMKIKADGSQTGTYSAKGNTIIIDSPGLTITKTTYGATSFGNEGGNYDSFSAKANAFTPANVSLTPAIGGID